MAAIGVNQMGFCQIFLQNRIRSQTLSSVLWHQPTSFLFKKLRNRKKNRGNLLLPCYKQQLSAGEIQGQL